MYGISLVGGKGQRLWPLTMDRPKPMVIVGGKPLLEHQIEWFKTGGVDNVVLLASEKAELIQNHFKDGHDFGINIIHFVDRNPKVGPVGAIKDALKAIPPEEEDVVISAGDVLTTLNLSNLIKYHKEQHLAYTLFTKPLQIPAGIVSHNLNIISEIQERPFIKDTSINTSIAVIKRSIEPHLPETGFNFWGEISTFFRGAHYTEPEAAWWHVTDISDAFRLDKELNAGRKADDLELEAKRLREQSEFLKMQAVRLRDQNRAGGKERY